MRLKLPDLLFQQLHTWTPILHPAATIAANMARAMAARTMMVARFVVATLANLHTLTSSLFTFFFRR